MTRRETSRSTPIHEPEWQIAGYPRLRHGGSCSNCGRPLQFWYSYKLCDRCVDGLPVLANSTGDRVTIRKRGFGKVY